MDSSSNCAWCEHSKAAGPTCSNCGADYAKADIVPVTAAGASAADKGFTKVVIDDSASVADPNLEERICIAAMPSMLTFAFLVQISGFGSSEQSIVFGIPIHELGHATVSWFCGFNAVPTLWKTFSPADRGIAASVVLFVAIAALANHGRQNMKNA